MATNSGLYTGCYTPHAVPKFLLKITRPLTAIYTIDSHYLQLREVEVYDIYNNKDRAEVEIYGFEKHIKPPIKKNRYPLLLRVEAKNNEAVLTYLQGNVAIDKLRNFFAKTNSK